MLYPSRERPCIGIRRTAPSIRLLGAVRPTLWGYMPLLLPSTLKEMLYPVHRATTNASLCLGTVSVGLG